MLSVLQVGTQDGAMICVKGMIGKIFLIGKNRDRDEKTYLCEPFLHLERILDFAYVVRQSPVLLVQ